MLKFSSGAENAEIGCECGGKVIEIRVASQRIPAPRPPRHGKFDKPNRPQNSWHVAETGWYGRVSGKLLAMRSCGSHAEELRVPQCYRCRKFGHRQADCRQRRRLRQYGARWRRRSKWEPSTNGSPAADRFDKSAQVRYTARSDRTLTRFIRCRTISSRKPFMRR